MRWCLPLAFALLAAGCSPGELTRDPDPGTGQDAAGQDSGPGVDVGPGVDTGPTGRDTGGGCDCAGRMCGDDGCGGSCGSCGGGQTCNAAGRCVTEDLCGNGRVDPGETCDGDCPTSCSSEACVMRALTGSAGDCNARCEETPITACRHGDGCCGSGCTLETDDDCLLDCTDLGSWPADWAAEEMRALEEMNRHRGTGYTCASGPRMSVPPYTMSPEARIAARCHSQDMAEENYFSHTGSDGSNFSTRMRRAGYTGGPRYENIAAGNAGGVASVGQWMGSSTGHCDAVMASNANEVGIGYYRRSGSRWTHYWTAVMGAR